MNWKSFNIITLLFALAVNAQQDYSHNVVRKGNQVYLTGFKPMSQKGNTCSFYSTSMILAYYGKYVSPDKLKRKGKSYNPFSGRRKSSNFMEQRLKNFGFTYIIIRHNGDELFRAIVKYAIDNGIPIRWECNMRFSPVKRERSRSAHARILTGYVENNGKITNIFYTDSWGERYINRIMSCQNAIKMTNLYGPIFPQKNNQKLISDFNALIDLYKKTKYVSNPQIAEEDDEIIE